MNRVGSNARRTLIASALLLAGLGSTACAVAPGEPPAPPAPAEAETDEEPYLDGSLDGTGPPAGIEELAEEGALEERVDEPDASAPLPEGPVLSFDEEIRAQFGSLFLDPSVEVPPQVTEQVARYVEMFHAGRARENYERWLAREGLYRDLILAELRAEGLPEELLYLAMLESGFNPTAVSRARAVGLWQFMRATGRETGLRIDDWVDERRDPIASTRAAIRHLKVLYRELDDWALAAAAYNAGLGRVRRAQRPGLTRYFDLVAASALPAETRSYVPLIIAAGHVAANRERYGFSEPEPVEPFAYDSVTVGPRTRLSAVARTAGVEVEAVQRLNTHLIGEATPPGGSWNVRVPMASIPWDFHERLAALPLEERVLPEYRETWWTVKSGDSWWRIANKHGLAVRTLRARNPRIGEMLHPGMRILVERRPIYGEADLAAARRSGATVVSSGGGTAGAGSSSAGSTARSTPTPPRGAVSGASTHAASGPASSSYAESAPPAAASRVDPAAAADADGFYVVRPGDTMSELAVALGITTTNLAAWNGMAAARPLRAGERLRVTAPPGAKHRVARGETLTSVARRYGVRIADLVRWNGMETARPLREGEVLVVRQGDA